MKIAIRYHSRTGNTKKLADAIGSAVNVRAETTDIPLSEPIDILFLCSAVYAAGVDNKIKDFISSLDASKVKNVVNISTAAILPSTYSQVAKLLEAKRIHLDSREFHCRGKFTLMHSGRPNTKDLDDVKAFAQSIVGDPQRTYFFTHSYCAQLNRAKYILEECK